MCFSFSFQLIKNPKFFPFITKCCFPISMIFLKRSFLLSVFSIIWDSKKLPFIWRVPFLFFFLDFIDWFNESNGISFWFGVKFDGGVENQILFLEIWAYI